MANVPTAEQTVFPEQGGLPNASPAAFGAPVARAQGEIGAGLGQTGDILATRALAIQGLKNEATANDADVNFQQDLGQLENSFYALKGRAASDAYPKFQSDVQALRKQYLGSMTNPMAANMLDQSLGYSISRSMRQGGMFAGEQTRQWVSSSQKAKVELLVDQSGRNFNDGAYYANAQQGIRDGVQAYGQTEGWSPEQIQVETQKQLDAAAKNRSDSAMAALKGLPLDQQVSALAHAGDVYEENIVQGESKGNVGAVNPKTGAAGLYQFLPSTAAQYGLSKADLTNPDPAVQAKVHDAFVKFTDDNRATLTNGLGRSPTNAELSLAQQQGATGALKLLQNPNALATDIVGKDAVIGNGGAANMTAEQFSTGVMNYYHMNEPTGLAGNAPAAWASQLSPDQQQEMRKGLITQADAQQAQSERDQRFAVWQKQQAVDTTVANYQKEMIAHRTDPNANPPVDLVKMADDPAFADNPKAVRDLIAFQKGQDGPNTQSNLSANNTSALFGKLFPPNGQPTATQKDIDAAVASADPNQHISPGEHDWLTKQLADAKDPTSKRLNGQASDVFKIVERQIDPSFKAPDTGVSGHSPFSGQRMLQYKQAVQEKIAEFKAAGKDPSVLFDPTPGNKDYVGSPGFTAPYTRSLNDLMTEEMTGAESQPPATATDTGEGDTTGATGPEAPMPVPRAPVEYKSMGDLQAAINRHEISLPDAQQYALDKGFAKQAGVQPLPGKLHLDPSVAPKVPDGAPRPFGMGEYIENPDGSASNEITVTVENPKLNDGKPTILPSLWVVNGKAVKVSEDKAAEFALKSGLKFPSFANEDEAEKFAVAREAKWQNIDPKNAGQVQALWDQGPKVPIGP